MLSLFLAGDVLFWLALELVVVGGISRRSSSSSLLQTKDSVGEGGGGVRHIEGEDEDEDEDEDEEVVVERRYDKDLRSMVVDISLGPLQCKQAVVAMETSRDRLSRLASWIGDVM